MSSVKRLNKFIAKVYSYRENSYSMYRRTTYRRTDSSKIFFPDFEHENQTRSFISTTTLYIMYYN